MSDGRPSVLVITGPTGTGKTELGVRVAELLDGEIISADSRQVYRDLDLGTAKPDTPLRERVRHHGLDAIAPTESYSAGQFARDARRWIAEIESRGRVPVVVGGTGLFIRVLIDPLAPEPEFDPERRSRLRRFLEKSPVERLHRWLARLDPDRARALEGEGGRQRLSRALEVVLQSGRPQSWWLGQPPAHPPIPAVVYGLRLPREVLYARLDRRFDAMIDRGLVDEVRALLDRYPADAPGFRTLGYAEIIGFLRGARSLEESVALAKRNTRQFARRQMTWFRHQLPREARWLDARRTVEALAGRIEDRWRSQRPGRAGVGGRSGSGARGRDSDNSDG